LWCKNWRGLKNEIQQLLSCETVQSGVKTRFEEESP